MLCPVCRDPMIIVEFGNVELDTCVRCRGLWFDAQELGQLFELAGVSQRIGELELQLDRLPHAGPRRMCPRCRGRLEPVRAPSSSGELLLDECPRGDGLWFDKGELASLLNALLGGNAQALANVQAFLGEFMSVNLPSENVGD
ncbi:MAG: TFIIB-type zinc ribbon-containing protein [Pirellulaceae bacterium]